MIWLHLSTLLKRNLGYSKISKVQCTMREGVREDTVNNYWQLHTLMNCEKEKATSECQNNNSNTVQERKSYDCHVDVQS
jgi:hypothetical protein